MTPRRTARPSPDARGFTMPELLVVMGIIVLFIALAIPAFNAITGTRSIASAENNLAAVLVRAREEAIGLQEIRGVLLTIDPKTDRVMALLVHQTDGPKAGIYASQPITWLDLVPDREQLLLPVGVRVQTAFDGFYSQLNDRYLGFNPAPIGNNNIAFGGVILFDSNGRLVVREYGFPLYRVDSSTTPVSKVPTGIADLMYLTAGTSAELNDAVNKDPYIPFVTDTNPPSTVPPVSQTALVLFDKKDFDTQGFVDADNQQNEDAKEKWIDDTSTPILINRFTGGMIRGE